MKKIILVIIAMFLCLGAYAQENVIDYTSMTLEEFNAYIEARNEERFNSSMNRNIETVEYRIESINQNIEEAEALIAVFENTSLEFYVIRLKRWINIFKKELEIFNEQKNKLVEVKAMYNYDSPNYRHCMDAYHYYNDVYLYKYTEFDKFLIKLDLEKELNGLSEDIKEE